MMMTLADVKHDLVAEAVEDFVDFSLVLAFVHQDLAIEKKPADRELTLRIVQDLLTEDLLVPGFPIGDGPNFDAWDVSVNEAMTRFEKAWDKLDRDPIPGEISWFVATPKGRRRVFDSYVAELRDRDVSIEEKKRTYASLLRMAGGLEDWAWYLETPSVEFKESDIDWKKVAELEAGLEAG